MKWYFASRTRHRENLTALKSLLEKIGEEVVSDWYLPQNFISTEVSYEKQAEDSCIRAEKIVAALHDTDVFVLISDPEGTDMFVELGVCLGHCENKKIYIVGEHSKRSLMQLHPAIMHAKTMREVFEKEGIAIDSALVPDFE